MRTKFIIPFLLLTLFAGIKTFAQQIKIEKKVTPQEISDRVDKPYLVKEQGILIVYTPSVYRFKYSTSEIETIKKDVIKGYLTQFDASTGSRIADYQYCGGQEGCGCGGHAPGDFGVCCFCYFESPTGSCKQAVFACFT